ncbi:Spy/CpxP family protein refolding chaperone [Flagellimonas myxillae]|uniref:Spy/CpxP family protein refolding chaperone n=1 Tax=Flagellimonas myxillae TaxID=2942214 RepID=UPI00201F490E|nr:hypothetical protein [Muricauda myxillae]MCL6268245.1 hypothetical protein [Muricauda myxillae]
MKKNPLLIVFLVFLMVMNGVLLYLVLDKPDRKPRPSRDFIIQELGLTDEQTVEFRNLEREHWHRMKQIDHQLRDLRHELFRNAQNEVFSEKERDSLVAVIGILNQKKDVEVFDHFRNIGSVCTPEQRIKLERILLKAMKRGPRMQGPPGERPPRDGHPPGPPPH